MLSGPSGLRGRHGTSTLALGSLGHRDTVSGHAGMGKAVLKEFWRNLIGSVVVLALSGVTYLAFTEPPLYRVLYILLISLVGIAYVGSTIWNVAIISAGRSARHAILEYKPKPPKEVPWVVPLEIADAAGDRVAKLELPAWIILVFFVAAVYLSGLLSIPMLRESLEKPETAPHRAENSHSSNQVP